METSRGFGWALDFYISENPYPSGTPSLAMGFSVVGRHDMGTLTPSEMEEQLHDPYEDTPKYARASVYFLCAIIGVFGVVNLLQRMRLFKRCLIYVRSTSCCTNLTFWADSTSVS